MSVNFNSESEFGQALTDWWSQLEGDRGARAELRRCDSATKVVMTPTFHRQLRVWQKFFAGEKAHEERLAQIIGLLAHVKGDRPDASFAVQMATAKGGEPAVSELRFRRLLQRPREEFYQAMIRTLRLLRGEANIHSLAESIYYWGDEVRKRWAYDYFGNFSQ